MDRLTGCLIMVIAVDLDVESQTKEKKMFKLMDKKFISILHSDFFAYLDLGANIVFREA